LRTHGFKRFCGRLLVGSMLTVIPACVSAADAQNPDTFRYLSLFGDVFERVKSDYVEDVSDKELIEAAIQGMLASLDPHSSFMDEESFSDMRVQTRGEFGGLGIEVTMEQGLVKVVSPIEDTPAFNAGLQPNDLISHLDGEPVQGLDLAAAVEKMRGPVGSDLTLTIRRGESIFDVTLTRAVVKVRSVRWEVRDTVGYVRISSFSEQTEPGLLAAVEKIKAQLGDRLAGYVLDLRFNPGGLLDQAVAVSDAFMEEGEIVSTRGRKTDSASRFNAKPGDIADGKPLVVLINEGSASASEIVAGALQDHRRAVILGMRSFGKGSVQTIIPLQGNAAMRLTTQRYYTPSGRSIQGTGIAPDIEVQQAKLEEVNVAPGLRREGDLPGALTNDHPDAAGVPPVADKPVEKPADTTPSTPAESAAPAPAGEDKKADAKPPLDYQLERALDLIRGYALLSQRSGH
jgi:carboxyl-terminal processing protease